jgi:hypothetical protein
MSTAFYPTNMRRQSTGGYSNKSTLDNIPYVSWKGRGIFSNPVAVTSAHIRPLTNNDYGNVFPTGFGLPRPIKHYRKGTVIPVYSAETNEQTMYNLNRSVKSSIGAGLISQTLDMPGSFVVKDNKFLNLQEEDTNNNNNNKACHNCHGAGLVSSWMPITNLSENPNPEVSNPVLCCNQQRKAIRRVLPPNTNIAPNYYQTTYMYLYNRCQTFKQRQFNFVSGPVDKKIEQLFLTYPFVTAKILEYSKPGDPLSIMNLYVAQCNPNGMLDASVEIGVIHYLMKTLLDTNMITQDEYTHLTIADIGTVPLFLASLQQLLTPEQYTIIVDYLYSVASNPYTNSNRNNALVATPKRGCSQVYYKPNNPQFAKQGGVSSSTRILKLNVDTINTVAYHQRKLKSGNPSNTATAIQYGFNPNIPFIYKDKVLRR